MKLNLNTQNGYDIASALRGPDVQDRMAAYLKAVFTAPIRHLVGATQGWHRALDSDPTTPLTTLFTADRVYDYAKENDWVWHYASHVYCALAALCVPESDWRLEVLRDAAKRLADVFYGYNDITQEEFCEAWEKLETTWEVKPSRPRRSTTTPRRTTRRGRSWRRRGR